MHMLSCVKIVPFSITDDLLNHPCLSLLERELDLHHTCGYVTLLKTGAPPEAAQNKGRQSTTPLLKSSSSSQGGEEGQQTKQQLSAKEKEKEKEISEFLEDLKELGIGDSKVLAAPKPQEEPKQTSSEATETSTQETQPKGAEAAASSQVETQAESETPDPLTDVQKKLQSEWVPLELKFGIPLFSEKANEQVCEKVLLFLFTKVV